MFNDVDSPQVHLGRLCGFIFDLGLLVCRRRMGCASHVLITRDAVAADEAWEGIGLASAQAFVGDRGSYNLENHCCTAFAPILSQYERLICRLDFVFDIAASAT
jgi:hypothetical protein